MKTIWLACCLSVFCITAVASVKPPLDVGDIAPNFHLRAMDGTEVKLADYRGVKPVYLIFWNTWCPHCIDKVPRIIELEKQYQTEVKIIAINTSWSDSVEEIHKFQQQYQPNYQVVFDHGAKVTDRYDVWGAPTEFIIDINGVVRYRDQLPRDFSQHIAQWQQPSIDGTTTPLATLCNSNKKVC